MDNFLKVLKLIYLLIWIPLGILLIAGIIFLIVANPIGSLLESLPFGAGGGPGGGGPSSFGGPPSSGGESSGFPSEEMRQLQQQESRE